MSQPSVGDTFISGEEGEDGFYIRHEIDEVSDEHPSSDSGRELFSVGVRGETEFTYYDIYWSDEIGEWLQDGLDPEDIEDYDVDE